jgi:hypothetical protein
MTGPASPRAPVYVVGLAVRLLSAPHRDRYRREFSAELFDVPGEDQLRYALRVLSRTWALRAALTAHAPATIGETTMTKPLRCILRLHTWRTVHNEEGQPYQACTRCAAERESLSLSNHMGPSGGGAQGF